MRSACRAVNHYIWILAAVASLVFGSARALYAEGWVSPVSGSDAENLWANIPNAFDGDTASFSSDQSNRSGDGSVLELQLAAQGFSILLILYR